MCQTVILMIPGTWAHTNTVPPVVLLMRAAALRCVADGVIFNLRLAPVRGTGTPSLPLASPTQMIHWLATRLGYTFAQVFRCEQAKRVARSPRFCRLSRPISVDTLGLAQDVFFLFI